MTDQFLAGRLRTLALCESTTPPEAISALIGAACSIGMAQFTPAQVAAMLTNGIQAACDAATAPPGSQAH